MTAHDWYPGVTSRPFCVPFAFGMRLPCTDPCTGRRMWCSEIRAGQWGGADCAQGRTRQSRAQVRSRQRNAMAASSGCYRLESQSPWTAMLSARLRALNHEQRHSLAAD